MSRILDAIDKELNPRLSARTPTAPRLEWEKLLANAPTPSAAQIRAVAREAFYQPPAELQTAIGELQKLYERDCERMAEFHPGRALDAFRAHQKKFADSIANGGDPHNSDAWTIADWKQDFALKSSAYKTAVKVHSQKAHELVAPELDAFAQCVAEFADQIESNEQSFHEAFGLPFAPSAVLTLARKVEHMARQQTRFSNCGNSPKSIAAAFVL